MGFSRSENRSCKSMPSRTGAHRWSSVKRGRQNKKGQNMKRYRFVPVIIAWAILGNATARAQFQPSRYFPPDGTNITSSYGSNVDVIIGFAGQDANKNLINPIDEKVNLVDQSPPNMPNTKVGTIQGI